MKYARLSDQTILSANAYDPSKDDTVLFCADPACDAKMHFRAAAMSCGDWVRTGACFATFPKQEHAAACTAHEETIAEEYKRQNLLVAVTEGKNIVININLSLSDSFIPAARREKKLKSTEDVQDYVAVSAKTAEDLMKILEKIFDMGGKSALKKTFINHHGRTMPLEKFIVNAKEDPAALYRELDDAAKKSPALETITGALRLLHFVPTEYSRNTRKVLQGSPVWRGTKNGNSVCLLQRLHVSDENLKNLLASEEKIVLGYPALSLPEVAQVRRALRASEGKKHYLHIQWQIASGAQMAAAGDKIRSLLEALKP